MNKKYFEEYCSGCGLCKDKCGVQFHEVKGFLQPEINTKEQYEFCKKVCPSSVSNFNADQEVKLWGKYVGAFAGWSKNGEIRFRAASGGMITALCTYVLDMKICDEIIQIGADDADPYKIKLCFNRTKEEVFECMASRYITGLTYDNLFSQFDYTKKYAIVGKPCDIEAISNYMEIDPEFSNCILYRFTFFCAGAPSVKANKQMVKALGFDEKTIKRIEYRGNGWPGKVNVYNTFFDVRQMEYIDSWNNYLGRDIRKMCKFCINGTGIYSDISCGDLWMVNSDNNPVFDESEGQNIVLSRTQKGQRLLDNAKKDGYVDLIEYSDFDLLNRIQRNHYNMQSLMFSKIVVMKLFGNACPYNINKLLKLCKNVPKKVLIRTALGTLKRKLKRQI